MAELKTQKTRASVKKFIAGVEHETRRRDAETLVELMTDITGESPAMWGTSIVGFGSYQYKYDSGREGEWPLAGFSPRKTNLSVYIMSGFAGHEKLMARLGKHKTGRSCLYINKLDDIHIPTLQQLIKKSIAHVKKTYET